MSPFVSLALTRVCIIVASLSPALMCICFPLNISISRVARGEMLWWRRRGSFQRTTSRHASRLATYEFQATCNGLPPSPGLLPTHFCRPRKISLHLLFFVAVFQAYVALSRATTLDGLFLLDFNLAVVRAHSKVKTFYAALEVCGFVLLNCTCTQYFIFVLL